jgi:4-diphosphocytidyl-2-C-methyl-D-erythritol kinase
MTRAVAYAKVNLALVVGPARGDGRHELVTLLQAVELSDGIELEQSGVLAVEGFQDDTIVSAALEALALVAGTEPLWRVRIDKQIPVAAGLGGGSSDAAAALRLANAELAEPLADDDLLGVAGTIGADVPFFLRRGPQLATGDGTELRPVELPDDYRVLLVVPDGAAKKSTGAVYDSFDERAGPAGFEARADAVLRTVRRIERATDLAALPPNDLASSPLADELERAGAFRADVSGAGPTVYGLYEHAQDVARVAATFSARGQTFVTRPVRDDLPPLAR